MSKKVRTNDATAAVLTASAVHHHRAARHVAIVHEWWKWFLFALVVALLCAAACWLDGALAGIEVIRDVKLWCQEKREEQQAQRQAEALWPPSTAIAPPAPPPTQPPLAATGEEETRAALERLLGLPFVKVRPPWLRNTVHGTGRNLEIDCYNEALGIAVEYSGLQHSVYPNPFHSSPDEFAAQIQRDALKRQVCESRGLAFIVVTHTVPRKQIESFLRTALTQRGIPLMQ